MDYSSPDSSVHGISQARMLEWVGHFLLQGIFPTQGLNLHLLNWQADSLPPGYQRSPLHAHPKLSKNNKLKQNNQKKCSIWDFHGSTVVKTTHFQCRGQGFNPCSGNQDPTCHVAWIIIINLKALFKKKKKSCITLNLFLL